MSNINSRTIDEFVNRYGILVKESASGMTRYINNSNVYDVNSLRSHTYSIDYAMSTERVDAYEILIAKDKFYELIESQESDILKKASHEAWLRAKYPALQTAWEQYQLILAFVKDE